MKDTPQDTLYFPRTDLAKRLLVNLREGITHAITLFAPRRMGKTQFLLKDVKPIAEKMGFNVFYFSFMDQATSNSNAAFFQALTDHLSEMSSGKNLLLEKLQSIEFFGVGVELNESKALEPISVSQIINEWVKNSQKPILMLLDEIQELARMKNSDALVRSLRTGLDRHQEQIKVIFTGSSTNGLRTMFNDNKAPFFHFAHALDFPNLDRRFTDFLADIYQQRTGKIIDKEGLFALFEQANFTPLYLRAIVQDMILNPDLSLEEAATYRFSQINQHSGIEITWKALSELERQMLILIAQGNTGLYSADIRQSIADKLGINTLSTSTVQGKLRKLQRADLITRDSGGNLKINNSHIQMWISEQN